MICCEDKQSEKNLTAKSGKLFAENAVNINTATSEQLQRLPNIGEKTAANIIAFRTKYGNFRKPEHLLLVQGISDKKYRELKNYVAVE